MQASLPTIAGFVSTTLFALGALPMLVKAKRTRNLASYSLGNILLYNVGNLVYSLYVFQLPPGPIWFLHSYNLVITALMLVWYLRYEGLPPVHWTSILSAPRRWFSSRYCSLSAISGTGLEASHCPTNITG